MEGAGSERCPAIDLSSSSKSAANSPGRHALHTPKKKKSFSVEVLDVAPADSLKFSEDINSFMGVPVDPNHWTRSERWFWVISLFFGHTLLYASRTLVPVCSVAISKEFGWTKSQAGAVLGAFFWGYILTQYLSGWLADRVGGEQVVTLGALGWGAITLCYPLLGLVQPLAMDALFWMLVMRLLHGLFQACHMPSVGSLMSLRVHLRERSATFSVLSTGAYFGTLLAGSVGSLLLESFSWRVPFYCMGVATFMWIMVTRWLLIGSRHTCSLDLVLGCLRRPMTTFRLLRQRHMAHMKVPYTLTASSETPVASPESVIISISPNSQSPSPPLSYHHKHIVPSKSGPPSPSKSSTGGPNSPPLPWRKLFSRKEFWAMMLGHYAYGHAHNILFSWLPTYFHDSFPEAKGWVFNVVPWLVTIPTSLAGGLVADHLITNGHSVTMVRKLMETLCLLGSCIFLCGITWTKDSYLQSLTCMALAVSCHGFHCSGILLNPMDLAPEHGGAVFGIVNMCSALPGFLAVYFAGFVLQYTKSWIVVFNQTAFVCFLGWLIYVLFGSAERII